MKVGTKAPEFTLQDGDGNTVRLSNFAGRKLVLYFYPKDMTPGCTTEACDFRDLHQRFAKAGVAVVGVSPDPAERHRTFTSKYELNFPLLADTDHAVAEAYEVWKEKKLYGRTFMGIERTTFLIDEKGRIEKVWRKVKVKDHAREVLSAAAGSSGVSGRLGAASGRARAATSGRQSKTSGRAAATSARAKPAAKKKTSTKKKVAAAKQKTGSKKKAAASKSPARSGKKKTVAKKAAAARTKTGAKKKAASSKKKRAAR